MPKLLISRFVLALVSAGFAAAEKGDAPIPETEIIVALQNAIRTADKDWFVSHMHFPVRYYGKTKRVIKSKEWFLAHYDTIIGPDLRASVLAQDPENYFKNYQGLMVGEGSHNIWFGDFGDGDGYKYEIITINNSD